MTLVPLTYGVTSLARANGFLAVYVAGMVMGNSAFVQKKSLIRFHDGLAWLMQIVMFLVLGLQVFPSHLVPVISIGLVVAAFLMLVARPVSVFLGLSLSRMSLRKKGLIAWDGLGLLFALLICGTGALIIAYASAYLHGHRHLGRFHGLLLAFMAAMLGPVLAGDLITLFIFWELTGLCSYLLIGFDHERKESRAAALQALLITGIGGLALLAGFILLGQAGGSPDITELLTKGERGRI